MTHQKVDNIIAAFVVVITILSVAVVIINISTEDTDTKESVIAVNTVCVEGVEYIQNYTSHGYSVLTPKIDAKTLAYTRCE